MVIQTWVEGFSSDELGGLKVPTWATLKRIPLEIRHWASAVAANLGQIIGVNTGKRKHRKPRLSQCSTCEQRVRDIG